MLEYFNEVKNGCLNIYLKGRVNSQEANTIDRELVPVMGLYSHVIIDSSAVIVDDYASLGMLLSLSKKMREVGTTLIILNLKVNT